MSKRTIDRNNDENRTSNRPKHKITNNVPQSKKPKLGSETTPITFFLNDAIYVPHDQHRIYLTGRSVDKEGICAVTTVQHSFYINRRTPFKNYAEVKNFLIGTQSTLNQLDKVNIQKTPYWEKEGLEEPPRPISTTLGWTNVVDGFGTRRQKHQQKKSYLSILSENLYGGQQNYRKGGRDPTVSENLAAFCDIEHGGFELINNKHKTAAYYTPMATPYNPEEMFEQVVKITVRLPYMAQSLHQFFESNEYVDLVKRSQTNDSSLDPKYHGLFDFIRTYEATEEVGTRALSRLGMSRATWCTINKYMDLPQKVFYRNRNIQFDLKDMICDRELVQNCPMRALAMDAEMPSPFDPVTGKLIRFCKPWAINGSTMDISPEGQSKTDPVAVLTAIIFEVGGSEGLDFIEAKAFVYKNPRAKKPTVKPADWEIECRRNYCYAMLNQLEKYLKNATEGMKNCVVSNFNTLERNSSKDPEKVNVISPVEKALSEKIDEFRYIIYYMEDLYKQIEQEKRGEKIDSALKLEALTRKLLEEIKVPWGYEKLQMEEYHNELNLIYAFANWLHIKDIDLILGWNSSNFDFPYLLKRFIYLRAIAKDEDKKKLAYSGLNSLQQKERRRKIPYPNFGSFVNGFSTLKKVDSLYNKKGGTSEAVHLAGYIENDGNVMYKKDGEKKPYSLNVCASKIVSYPISVVTRSFILQKYTYDTKECDPNSVKFAPNQKSATEDNPFYVTNMSKEQIDAATYHGLLDIENKFSTGVKQFNAKKVEFDHALGIVCWEEGGMALTRYVLYCMIDSFLAWATLRDKGKLIGEQSFAHVAEIDVGRVYERGGLYSVTNKIKAAIHRFQNGKYLIPDKGNRHFHFAGVWDHPNGPYAGVCSQWDRLKNFKEHEQLIFGSDLNLGETAAALITANRKTRRGKMVVKEKKKKKDPKAGEGGYCQPNEDVGVQEGYVPTLDFRSMYPYILYILNLCLLSALNRTTIERYKVYNYEYFSKLLGSASRNMCGNRKTDEEEALLAGCYTSDVKITYFHQGAPTVLGPLVLELAQERNDGKESKGAWWCMENAIGNLSEEEYSKMTSSLKNIEKFVFAMYKNWRDITHKGQIPKKADNVSQLRSFQARLFKSLVNTISKATHQTSLIKTCKIQSDNFNTYQTSVKVFMNSMYGVLYMLFGPLSYPELSAVITSFGRFLLNLIRCIAERFTSDQVKIHTLMFNWSKKALDKDAMEILFHMFIQEQEEKGQKASWQADGARESIEKILNLAEICKELEKKYEVGSINDEEYEKYQSVKEKLEIAQKTLSVQNFIDFVQTKEKIGMGFLRHVDNQIIAKLSHNKIIRSFATIFSLYGDTDSIMTKLAQHSIVNRHQAFEYMNYVTKGVINNRLIPEMMLQPEKISETMMVHRQKKYEMKAFVEGPDTKIEWMFKGSDKSDTLPFVNHLLAFARKYFHLRLSEGYPRAEVCEALCLHIKRKLFALISGEVPLAELAITKKLTTLKIGGPNPHNRVAEKMLDRGENVGNGDLITYIRVLQPDGSSEIKTTKNVMTTNKFGIPISRKKDVYRTSVESLAFVESNQGAIKVDFISIWNDCIKNPLTSYLMHILAPITDFTPCNSVFPATLKEQEHTRNRKESLQESLVHEMMFKRPGDIEWRLKKRAMCQNNKKSAIQYGFQKYLRTPKEKNYFEIRITVECALCGWFFSNLEKIFVEEIINQNNVQEGQEEEETKSYSVKKENQTALKICKKCQQHKEEKIQKLRVSYINARKIFFEKRAYCTVCIQITETPKLHLLEEAKKVQDIEDLGSRMKVMKPFSPENYKRNRKLGEKYNPFVELYQESKPEDCTFVTCNIHVERTRNFNYMNAFQKKLESLESLEISEEEVSSC